MEKRMVKKFLNVLGREVRGMKPILLKCGLALALAFTLLVSTLTSEHEESNLPLLPPGDKMRKEETCINKVFDKNSPIILSPRTKQSGEKDEFLNDLMREGDFVAVNSSKKEVETPRSNISYSISKS